jgi:hypothetical protein
VSLDGEEAEVRQGMPRKILVSFQAPRADNFYASLKITFIDETRPNDPEFTVTRGLCGCGILPGGLTSNDDVSNTAMGVGVGGAGTGITVSPESGLEFFVERPRSDVPFATKIMQLVITKSSPKPWVSFKAAKLRSEDDSVVR